MGLFDNNQDQNVVVYKEESPFERMEEEYNGDTMQNLIFGMLLGVSLLFFLSVCWNYCATKTEEEAKEEKRNMVIAREIKPGIIVIQGTNEETLRIIEEYEAVRNNSGPTKIYNGMPAPGTSADYITGHMPVTSANIQQAAAQPDQYSHLIDFDANSPHRPPPYAPQSSLVSGY